MDIQPNNIQSTQLYTETNLLIVNHGNTWFTIEDRDLNLKFNIAPGDNMLVVPVRTIEFTPDVDTGFTTCDDLTEGEQQDANTDGDTFQVFIQPQREMITCEMQEVTHLATLPDGTQIYLPFVVR